MTRGFTLIEMLISLVVLAVLLAAAVPSFSEFAEKGKMKRFADEIQGYFIQIKSEAVLRNQDLYLHFVQDGEPYAGEWALVTNTSPADPIDRNTVKTNALMYLDGNPFKGIFVSTSVASLKVERINGRLKNNGNITFSIHDNKKLKLVFHTRSSVRICGDGGRYYGYPACSTKP